MSAKNLTIQCSNGSLKNGSSTSTCSSDDDKCFANSYQYCHKFTTRQIATMVVVGVLGLILASVLTKILSGIPLLGLAGALAINLVVLVALAGVIYMMYQNYHAKPSAKKT